MKEKTQRKIWKNLLSNNHNTTLTTVLINDILPTTIIHFAVSDMHLPCEISVAQRANTELPYQNQARASHLTTQQLSESPTMPCLHEISTSNDENQSQATTCKRHRSHKLLAIPADAAIDPATNCH
ncbi:unnamed protein product [Vicia faba]|uniref:Uncharacterized protein n=1 Tax=Vicia faba TaxID=3906 RepID=A0AAV1AJR8_VICFA|nr:unnamed protein product [Vicia faba]